MKTLSILFFIANVIFVNASLNLCYNMRRSGLQTENLLGELEDDTDPIYVDKYDLEIHHPAARLVFNFTNVYIWSEPMKIQPLINGQIVNITLPNMTLIGNYKLDGNIGELFDIFGEGDFWIHLYNFSVSFTILDMKLNDTSFCTRVSLDIDVQQTPMEFHGLMNDKELEDLFNKAFLTIAPEIIRDVWEEVKEGNDQRIENEINDLINSILPPLGNFLEEQIQNNNILPNIQIRNKHPNKE